MWPFDRPPPDELAPGTDHAEAQANVEKVGKDEVDLPDGAQDDKPPDGGPPPTTEGTSRK